MIFNYRYAFFVSIAFLLTLLFTSCGIKKIQECLDDITRDDLIVMAVHDFLDSDSELKSSEVFYVTTYQDKNILGVGILGTRSRVLMNDKVKIGDFTIMPSNVLVVDEKLFYWRDVKVALTEEVLSTLYAYDLIEYDSSGTKLVPEGGSDDSLEGTKLYYCRCDLTITKILQSNVALGYGKLPKLKCPR